MQLVDVYSKVKIYEIWKMKVMLPRASTASDSGVPTRVCVCVCVCGGGGGYALPSPIEQNMTNGTNI